MKQLPFLGKKTKPPALRKDQWRPLAAITFPTGHQGLNAYRELREFRKRHEHEWTYKKLGVRTRLEAGRKLMDQKANSIADMAAVLQRQVEVAETHQAETQKETAQIQQAVANAQLRHEEIKSQLRQLRPTALNGDDEHALKTYKALKNERMHIRRSLEKPMPHLALKHKYHPLNDPSPVSKRKWTRYQRHQILPRMSVQGLRIKWADILDAEFARTWPASVVHESLETANARTRHIHPPMEASPPPPPPPAPSRAEGAMMEKDEANTAVQTSPVAKKKPKSSEEPGRWERLIVRLQHGRN